MELCRISELLQAFCMTQNVKIAWANAKGNSSHLKITNPSPPLPAWVNPIAFSTQKDHSHNQWNGLKAPTLPVTHHVGASLVGSWAEIALLPQQKSVVFSGSGGKPDFEYGYRGVFPGARPSVPAGRDRRLGAGWSFFLRCRIPWKVRLHSRHGETQPFLPVHLVWSPAVLLPGSFVIAKPRVQSKQISLKPA